MFNAPDLYSLVGDSRISEEELTELRDNVQGYLDELDETIDTSESDSEIHDAEVLRDEWMEENKDAWEELQKVCDEVPRDETMIIDKNIDDYLVDMVNDCYDLPKNLPSFVKLTIDTDELKYDYSTVEFQGNTYWVRCS